MSRAIPPDLEPEVLAKYGEGWRSRKIAEWLKVEHGVECSHAAVARIVAHARTERADVAKDVVREKLSKTLTTDLDVLEAELRRVEKLSARLHKRAHQDLDILEKPSEADYNALRTAMLGADRMVARALEASATLTGIAKTKLHFAGADAPDDSLDELSQAEQRLASKLDQLAANSGANEGDPGDRSDASGAGRS